MQRQQISSETVRRERKPRKRKFSGNYVKTRKDKTTPEEVAPLMKAWNNRGLKNGV